MRLLNYLGMGPQDYAWMDDIQRNIHKEVADGTKPSTLLLWESLSVYTAGRQTHAKDLPDESVPVSLVDRGGSITYHGPGQVVAYPIVHLGEGRGPVELVRRVESAVVRALREEWGISAHQSQGRAGVWVTKNDGIDYKICAVGMRFSRGTTMHGLGFNVSTDLSKFKTIIPCGIDDAGVTSLADLGIEERLGHVGRTLADYLTAELDDLQ